VQTSQVTMWITLR